MPTRAPGGPTSQTWFPTGLATFVGLEGLATAEFVWEPLALPGMLQTPEYAEALLVDHLHFAPVEVPQVVNLRMARQELLTGDDPLRFSALIEETTLDRMVAGPRVMRRQLERLLALHEPPNIDLYVINVAVHDGLDGEFTLLDFDEAQSIAYIEIQDGAIYVQDQDRVAKYAMTRKRMCAAAVSPLDAIHLTAGWSTREQQFCGQRGSGLLASIDIDAYHQLARREAS